MTSTPPRLLEAVVTRLIPPMLREEFGGDLWERFRSPYSYVGDALRLLPFAIWRQLRRGGDGSLMLTLGLALFASLGGIWPGQGVLPALVTALLGLMALLLRDAYRSTDAWTLRRALGDAGALLAGLLVARLLVAMPLGWIVGGYIFTVLLMLLLRSGLELTNTGARLRMAALADPAAELRALKRNLGMRTALETATLGLLGAVALWFGLTANRPIVAAIALGWAIPTLLLVGLRALKGRRHAGSAPQLIAELERQKGERQLAWWWLVAPLFAGLAFDAVLSLQQPGTALAGIAAALLLGGLLVQLTVRRRELLDLKITQLKDLAAA